MKNQIPVYLFIGFLEGGKTHMIQESMEDQRFNSGEKTMIICCEEGIDEYDVSRFWGKNIYIENIEKSFNFSIFLLIRRCKYTNIFKHGVKATCALRLCKLRSGRI